MITSSRSSLSSSTVYSLSKMSTTTSTNELLEFMKGFKSAIESKMEVANTEAREMREKLKGIDSKIEDLKLDADKTAKKTEVKDKKYEMRMDRMENRMRQFEEERRRSNYWTMKANKLRQLAEQPEGNAMEDRSEQGEKEVQMESSGETYRSGFAQHLEQLQGQLKEAGMENQSNPAEKLRRRAPGKEGQYIPATEKVEKVNDKKKGEDKISEKGRKEVEQVAVKTIPAKETENERGIVTGKPKKSKGMKVLRRWFGDETESEEDMTEDSEDDVNEWDMVARRKKNKEKKKLAMRKKLDKVESVNKKASHIQGIGPIRMEDIEEQRETGMEYEEAKTTSLKKFLKDFLMYEEKELSDMSIKETMMSAKGDAIMYIAFEDIEDLKELNMRIAECGNREIKSRNFIPPQAFDRYMAISNGCYELRQKNPKLKTQIRFGKQDLEVVVKTRGESEPYRPIPLEEVMGQTSIPQYDFLRKWLARRDRPPRWKVVYAGEKGRGKHQLSRQASEQGMSKRSKADDMETTTRSGSGSDSGSGSGSGTDNSADPLEC